MMHDRLSVNRPYMFIFDHLRVIDELVSVWDGGWDGCSAQSSEKRASETGPAEGGRASKWRTAASSSDDELINNFSFYFFCHAKWFRPAPRSDFSLSSHYGFSTKRFIVSSFEY